MPTPFQTLVERKVIHWTLGYLAAAWATLEALGFLADLFGWGQVVVRLAAVLLGAGVLAVAVIAWFHGLGGRQSVTRLEVALLATIALAGGLVAAAVAPTGDLPTRPPEFSIAVLPPTPLPGGDVAPHFVTGMHEGLISQLASVGSFRVISRRSTAAYADSDRTLREIAEELSVDAVVESSIARPGDSVSLQVRLIQAAPRERLLWTGAFATGLPDVLAMLGDVVGAIASETAVELAPEEESRLASHRAIDPATYEAYLRGMHAIYRRRPASVQQGLEYLHDAVRRDPANAAAYAGLALGYAALGHGPAPPPDVWTRAREAAERAVALDPGLGQAHAALADVKLYYEWDWEGAEREFRRANTLNPSLAMNRYHFAWYLALMGRMEEAFVEHRLARDLDPLTPIHTAGLAHLHLGVAWDRTRGRRALEEARRALELDSTAVAGLHALGDAYTAMGRHDDAIAAHRRLVEVAPRARWILGFTYARAGREAEARRIRDELEAEPNAWNAFGLVVLNANLQDFDAAFEWLDYAPHHAWVPWVRNSPWTRPLQDDPRYREFLRRLELPAPGARLAAR